MRFRIRRPDDFHVHLRQGEMIKKVLGYTSGVFGRALVMPNTDPPIETWEDVVRYRDEILTCAKDVTPGTNFQPLMTIYLTSRTTSETVKEAFRSGAIAVKLYPRGATTASHHGIFLKDLESFYPVFRTMENIGMVLCLHGEDPDAPEDEWERAFLPILQNLSTDFPRLRIVLEHISSDVGVVAVLDLPDTVAATITLHHLLLTDKDLNNPHNICRPKAKKDIDRMTLIRACMSKNPKFFLGSDSAPHLETVKKEKGTKCFGVDSAPILIPQLLEIFQEFVCVERLEDFTSRFGAEFYGLPLNEGYIELVDEPWPVPLVLDGIVPFRAGHTLRWRIVT